MKNKAQGDVSRDKYSTRRKDKLGGALINILYFHFGSTLSCLNKIESMCTSFYNLSPSLKLMLQVKFLAERDDFLLHQCCDFIL